MQTSTPPAVMSSPISGSGDNEKDALTSKITEQGNKVRDLKTNKASKVRDHFYSILLKY